MGGMAAFIPNRRDPEVTENALAKVREDKSREAGDGFDGTWVAHPDLVPTAIEEFDACSASAEPDLAAAAGGVASTAAQLLAVPDTPGRGDRGGHPPERLGRDPVPRRLAERHRRGGDLQPDGGRRHRRDLALAALAVGAPRPRRSRPRPGDRRRGGGGAARHAAPRGGAAVSSSRLPSRTSSSTS